MNWYYVEAGKQAGPVTDEQLQQLIRNGTVRADTLVWREGMANWQPYAQVNPGAVAVASGAVPNLASAPVAGGAIVCCECARTFPPDSVIRYGDRWVCAECKPLFLQKLREGAILPGAGLVYAGFWIRALAKLIDGLIIGLVIAIPVLILVFAFFRSGPGPGPGQAPDMLGLALQILIQIGAVLISVAYVTFFLGKFGATPGKMACGLRVVTAEGERISYMRAFGRGWAEQLSGMICYIGYLLAPFDDQRRTLHDHICNTRVVRK